MISKKKANKLETSDRNPRHDSMSAKPLSQIGCHITYILS